MYDDISTRVIELLKKVDREVLSEFHGRLSGGQIQAKADASLVTLYDRLSEKALKEGLNEITPGAQVVGEESIDADPAEFTSLSNERDVWILDPIDGTGAYTRGEKTYAVVAALVQGGETTRGYLYIPGRTRREGVDVGTPEEFLVSAVKGQGTYLNGKRVSLDKRATRIATAKVGFACRNQDKGFEAVLAKGVAGYLPRFNAAYDYAQLLAGGFDGLFYSEGREQDGAGKCPPWDHAAGVLAVSEAGGYAALPYSPSGRPYSPLARHDRLLVASSRDLWESLYWHVRSRVEDLCRPHSQASGVASG